MLQLMSNAVLQEIAKDIKADEFFSLMVDETTDVSVKEQLIMVLRHVSDNFEISEEFVGLYSTDTTNADTITKIIRDILLRLDIPLKKCRGQCYNGASSMSGCYSGVQARILEEQPNAFYVHCSSHVLNLVLQDATRSVTMVRDTIDFIQTLVNFVRDSPKRLACFTNLQNDTNATSLRPLCPTRWTMRCSSIRSVLENYTTLKQALEEISGNDRGQCGSKASGLLQCLNDF